MRVISGIKKGYRLKAPKGKNTRPTEDRIKESLFNILMNISSESVVLDLFAGSGSIGIEFLSRGANKAYVVDRDYNSIRCIKDNLEHTKLNEKSVVIKDDAFKAIMKFNRNEVKFDYIFVDPPYGEDLITKIIKSIYENEILNKRGILILEHEKRLSLKSNICGLRKNDNRDYGSKTLSFYIYDE